MAQRLTQPPSTGSDKPSAPNEPKPVELRLGSEGYRTDEEQAEALIAWFKRHSSQLTTGIVIGIALLFGWRIWQDYQTDQAIAASQRFESVVAAFNQEGASEGGEILVARLKEDYDNTYYATMAALLQAKQKAAAGDYAAADEELSWVIENADETTADLARLRLARIQLAQSQFNRAEALLDAITVASYDALVAELRGDLHRQRGNFEQARSAYDEALATLEDEQRRRYLELKRDSLGTLTSPP